MVTAKVRVQPEASLLQRLAVVYADPLRLKIITELYMREMSPKQFRETYGGGTAARVDRHFKKLALHGWLRLVRKESGGKRRGATEHFYRAISLPIFDYDTWCELPQTLKVEFSWRVFEQYAERVKEALEAGTFDSRTDRHLSWTPLGLDELGRGRVIAAVDALFESIFEEQSDTKLRIAKSNEEPLLATVGLTAFESPSQIRNQAGLNLRVANTLPQPASTAPFTVRIAKVFADPLNLKIVTELNLRAMSPTQFHEEHRDHSRPAIQRRFADLTKLGWLQKVDEKTGGRRRGGREQFFRATGPAIFDTLSWSLVPKMVRTTRSWRTFEQLAEQVREAMDAGTFDARPDRHHTWTLLSLDELGWRQVITVVDTLFEGLFEEQRDAERRMMRSGEKPIWMTVNLAVFESPKPGARAEQFSV